MDNVLTSFRLQGLVVEQRPLGFLFALVACLLFVGSLYMARYTMREDTIIIAWLFKLTRYVAFLTETVLFIPVVSGLASQIAYTKCWMGANVIYSLSSIVLLPVFLLMMAIVASTLYDDNVRSLVATSRSHSRVELVYLAFRALVAFAFATFRRPIFRWLLISTFMAGASVISLGYSRFLPYYRPGFNKLRTALCWALCWAGLCMAVALMQGKPDSLGSTLAFMAVLPLALASGWLLVKFQWLKIQVTQAKDLVYEFDAELKLRQILEPFVENVVGLVRSESVDEKKRRAQVMEQAEAFLEEASSENFRFSAMVNLVRAGFELQFQNGIFNTFCLLQRAAKLKPYADLEYTILRRRHDATNLLAQDDDFQDIMNYISFENHRAKARKLDEHCSQTLSQFCQEVSSKSPNKRLFRMAGVLQKAIFRANVHYQILLRINPRSIDLHQDYAGFLRHLRNEYEEAEIMDQKSKELTDQLQRDMALRTTSHTTQPFREKLYSNEYGILVCCTMEDSFMTITSINQRACQMLGYGQAELIGQNVKLVIPDPFAACHDGLARANLSNNNVQAIAAERMVLSKLKSSYISPLRISIRRFASKDSASVSMLALLQSAEARDVHHCLVNPTGRLLGISQGIQMLFNVDSKRVAEEEVQITEWFADYYTNRTMYISTDGALLACETANSGELKVTVKQNMLPGGESVDLITISDVNTGAKRRERSKALVSGDEAGLPAPPGVGEQMQTLDTMEAEDESSLNEAGDEKETRPLDDDTRDLNDMVRRLINNRGTRGNRFVRQLRYAFLVRTMLALGVTILVYGYVDSSLNDYAADVAFIHDAGKRRLAAVNIAYLVHWLNLMQQGVEDPSFQDAAKQEIRNEALLLSNVDILLKNNDIAYSEKQQAILTNAGILLRSQVDSNETSVQSTLWDADRLLVMKARLIAASDLEDISMNNEHVFFVLKNSATTILKAMNDSAIQ